MAISFGSKNVPLAAKKNTPTANPVPMKSDKAACLYQPVDGTSNVYKIFCYNAQVAVAARVQGKKVSIRVEPRPGFAFAGSVAPFVKHMETLGVTGKSAYLSGHMMFTGLTLWHVLAPIAFNPVMEWTEVARDLTQF